MSESNLNPVSMSLGKNVLPVYDFPSKAWTSPLGFDRVLRAG
jgi:hypothetical protein